MDNDTNSQTSVPRSNSIFSFDLALPRFEDEEKEAKVAIFQN